MVIKGVRVAGETLMISTAIKIAVGPSLKTFSLKSKNPDTAKTPTASYKEILALIISRPGRKRAVS